MTQFLDGANRIPPQLPVTAMKTYRVAAPLSTHWRPASCAEVQCQAHHFGWVTTLDPSDDLGKRQIGYIMRESGRRFAYELTESGLVQFTFEAGQDCFRQHQLPRERDPIYLVRDGDFRGNPTGRVRKHTSPDDWVDDFATHQQNLADRAEQG